MKVRQINAASNEETERARKWLEENAPMVANNITKICQDAIQSQAKKHGWKKGATK